MYKKTKIRQILILDYAGESNSNIASSLSVSRNSIAEIKRKVKEANLSFEETSNMTDEQLYERLFQKSLNENQVKLRLIATMFIMNYLRKV